MRLIQFKTTEHGRRLGLIQDDKVYDLTSYKPAWQSVYSLFFKAKEAGKHLEDFVGNSNFRGKSNTLDYSELLSHRFGENSWVLPSIDHPDPAHCFVTGTGLTHLGSMAARDQMHASKTEVKQKTDSQKMFDMGLEGGKPAPGKRGVSPEWFYKGTAAILRSRNDYLDIPPFSQDCGEEPEIAGCYIIGQDGVPYRLGFTIANEWSDHITERVNYLWLAHSKLRTCSAGPEMVTDQPFKDIRGYCRIYRDDSTLYDSGELLTGEDNMNHSLANLEDHHFKYEQFRQPGDVHIHFFGTMKLSSGSRPPLQNEDKIQIHFDGMGADLVNYVKRIPSDSKPIVVQKA